MKQLVVKRLPEPGQPLHLDAEQRHYLVHVRRCQSGDRLVCTDPQGNRAVVELAVQDEEVLLRYVDVVPAAASSGSPRSRSTLLAAALLKGRRFETVIRQATELGVSGIVPVLAEHCVSRPDARELARKSTRWEAIAREATQQSGRAGMPDVHPPLTVRELAVRGPGIVLDESGGRSLQEALAQLADETELRFVVGPEGGLSADERALLRDAGWIPVHLPLPVLRAETAAVAATALVQLLGSDYTSALPHGEPSDG